MVRCVSCSAEFSKSSVNCPRCGTPATGLADEPTEDGLTNDLTVDGPPTTPSRPISRPPTSPSAAGLDSSMLDGESGYAAGTILAGRYRIIGLLGQGGMGQVYRADDLSLGQPVALKLLPEKLARDASRLERFRSEVRVSRQVSHPNVCRVHDIGETNGQLFLSMELVDGGDLSSLLKRVGRLPSDKGLEIARQLCAGLAAAHDRGVLHRDLKPANIMVDSEGRVRIADFGLAGLAGGFEDGDIRSGTPAYMAPETLAGEEVTQKSDIYALGLVLYEIFTGKQAVKANTVNEYLTKHRQETPTMPSDLVSGLDPEIESVVLQCLAKDPSERPATALAVSMMLPGGDPLAAMLAAGETPSPELIAQAGDESTLTPGRAWMYLAITFVLLFGSALMNQPRHLLRLLPLERPPEVQLDRALETLEALGIEVPRNHTKIGFSRDSGLTREIHRDGVDAEERAALAEGELTPMWFWMRAAPSPLVRRQLSGRVTSSRPPREQPGEVFAVFDVVGRLQRLEQVPWETLSRSETVSDEAFEAAWLKLATAAGLDASDFEPTDPLWSPAQHVDRLLAWSRIHEASDTNVTRVEAGFRGAVVAYVRTVRGFEDIANESSTPGRRSSASQTVNVLLILSVLAGGAILARRNIHLGRVDSRGALRVAGVMVVLDMVVWILRGDHAVGAGNEFELFVLAVGGALFNGAFVWMLYMALEPEVRRHWPKRLISWERLLTRGGRDPLVGRHVLVGLMIGVGLTAMMSLINWVMWEFFEPYSETQASGIALMSSSRHTIGTLFEHLSQAVFSSLFITVLVLLARLALRRTWAAVVLASLIFVGLNALQNDPWYISAALSAILLIGVMYSLLRFGLLTLVVTILLLNLFQAAPLLLTPGGWQGPITAIPVFAVAVVAVVAFRWSLGNQSVIPME